MIVLDTATGFIEAQMRPPVSSFWDTGANTGVATVSYWSIDVSNIWTPRKLHTTLTVGSALPIGVAFIDTILPGPTTGEVSRVVENIWLSAGPGAGMSIMLSDGPPTFSQEIGGGNGIAFLILKRDGSLANGLVI